MFYFKENANLDDKNNYLGYLVSSYANFGIIPYGSSLLGRIFYIPSDHEACEPFGLDEIPFSLWDNPNSYNPVVLADRGNCSFVSKARNIQNIGGNWIEA